MPEDSKKAPKLTFPRSAKKEKAYIFVDHSNVSERGVDFTRMARLVESPLHQRSAEIATRFVAGSTPADDTSSVKLDSKQRQWEQAGYEVHTFPRTGAHGGREFGVDEMLHSKVFHQIHLANLEDNKRKAQSSKTAHTLVLLTGDGNDNSGRTTFKDTVEIALGYGWRVELWSWKHSLSRAFKELALKHPCTREGGPGLVLKFLDGSHSWLCHLP
jgi:hypothetical protein